MRKIRTVCPLDCPDACSLAVSVEDNRVVKVDGDHRNPLTDGYICAKVRTIARHVHGDRRVAQPGLRDGPKGEGRFRPVSWDEALSVVAARLQAIRREHSGEAILPLSYGGSNGFCSHDAIDTRLFRRLGASHLARTVCAEVTGRAAQGLYGRMPGVALRDYIHARLIVLWGVNPSATGIHLVPIVREAQGRGAKLVVIDPRRTPLAKHADLHLQVWPGTDVAVALAVHRHLFETGAADDRFLAEHTTGADLLRSRAARWNIGSAAREARIAAADLEQFAALYTEASPAAIRCGWGVERNRNGGSAVSAILALPAVAGKFGVRGGGFTLSNSRAFGLDNRPAQGELPPRARTINMNQVGRALLEQSDPAIHGLFVYNCNPLATLPNQCLVRRGLERDDLFTVVFDPVLTDTARYADVVLPATTFLEHEDLKLGYGAMVVGRIDPAIAPVGQSRPNAVVFAELCARLGLAMEGEPITPAQIRDALLRERADLRGPFDDGGVAARSDRVLFRDEFPRTTDHKIHLVPDDLDAEAPQGLYGYIAEPGRYPLALISPATRRTVSSTFGEQLGPASVAIHPEDAEARRIADGGPVRIHNELGEVRCLARVTRDVPPGVLDLPKGLWSHSTRDGNTANAVAPDALADLAGGATFNDARVDVEPEYTSSQSTRRARIHVGRA